MPSLRPELEAWRWFHAPATTLGGDPRISAREHHYHGEQGKTSLTLTLEEAMVMQSYSLPYPQLVAEIPDDIVALDLFAGTGWGVACKRLGIEEYGVELMEEAVQTRTANGMKTILRDVWDGLLDGAEILLPEYNLLIASPPCQTFSMAGRGSGRKALDDVLEAITLEAYKRPADLIEFGRKHDDRTALVLSPLAYVWRDRPKYVAFEQVPTVLPVWEACAEVMRGWGYSVKTEVLHAEQYGVPQTRKRAILVARLDGDVKLPTPTHSRYYSSNPKKLDPGVRKWVSMAEALGWGMTDEPMPTICAGTHGPTDRWGSGGSGVRKRIDSKVGGPNWKTNESPAEVDGRTQYTERIGVEEASIIQTYPMGRGLTERPSPTITGGGTETGGAEPIAKYHERYTNSEDWIGSTDRLTTDEAAALQTYPSWVGERPAPTVVGTRRSKDGMLIGRQLDDDSRQDVGGHQTSKGLQSGQLPGVRVSQEEAATLQTYPSGVYVHPMTNGRRGIWPADEPAPTIRGVNRPMPPGYEAHDRDACDPADAHKRLTEEEAAALQTYPSLRGGNQARSTVRPADSPAPTLHFGQRLNAVEWSDGERITEGEASTLQTYPSWGFTERPAVTLSNAAARGLGGGSGARRTVEDAMEAGTFIPSPHGDGTDYAQQTRILSEEAGVLQTYERPFIWKGNKTKTFLQIGNAVPPLLAQHILSALLDDTLDFL